MPYEVSIRRFPPFGLLNVRADATARPHLGAALGFTLPRTPNTTTSCADVLALWLGPDEWLLRTTDGTDSTWLETLRRAGASHHCAITVESDAYIALEITGREAREVLCQGTGIDTHPGAFVAGQCARVRFAKTQVVIYQADAPPSYHLYVPRSYANYLTKWLEGAMGHDVDAARI